MPSAHQFDATVIPANDGGSGAIAVFPFDRATVERFQKAFPRARWSDERRAWFIPGTTAERRVRRWLGGELSNGLTYADEKGRDDFAFDPIQSRYLEAADDLRVRTPYSRSIVAELRNVPWARWDDGIRAWRIPFRSWEDLRRRWPAIEAAAQRNEPEERKKQRAIEKHSGAHEEAAAKSRERRRRRYPVPVDTSPPTGRVVMTTIGAVVFTDITGECVEDEVADRYYAGVSNTCDLIWATWRRPSFAELVAVWPSRQTPDENERRRGWWNATLEELRHERRKAKSIDRARASRRARIQ